MNPQHNRNLVRFVILILGIAVFLFGSISITGVAAQSSIPGDALYPVKTSIEQTRLSLAQDAGERAQLKMVFAEQRLEEIDALIKVGRYQDVNEVTIMFEAEIHSAIMELETISKLDPDRATSIALEISAALARYSRTLSGMLTTAPQMVQVQVARALDTTQIASGIQGSITQVVVDDHGNDNINGNTHDDANTNLNGTNENGNTNSDDATLNANTNEDAANANSNGENSNLNGNDDHGNMNNNDDTGNTNGNDDNGNTNGSDDHPNGGLNDNSGHNSGDDKGGNGGHDTNANDSGGGGGGGGGHGNGGH